MAPESRPSDSSRRLRRRAAWPQISPCITPLARRLQSTYLHHLPFPVMIPAPPLLLPLSLARRASYTFLEFPGYLRHSSTGEGGKRRKRATSNALCPMKGYLGCVHLTFSLFVYPLYGVGESVGFTDISLSAFPQTPDSLTWLMLLRRR